MSPVSLSTDRPATSGTSPYACSRRQNRRRAEMKVLTSVLRA
jgi:hypothetical protein